MFNRFKSTGFTAVVVLGLICFMSVSQSSAQEKGASAAPQAKSAMPKICGNCHSAEPGTVLGTFDSVAPGSIQIKIDDATEIITFDSQTLKIVDAGKQAEVKALRSIKKGHEIRIAYTEKDGIKTATTLVTKPPIKVASDMLMTTAEVEKLVAVGPEKGKYVLIDARPAPKFMEGSIPTAINIPDHAFDKMKDKLPKEKDMLVVFFCGGVT